MMYIHDMTEVAYKNGYEAGINKFAERLKEKAEYYSDLLFMAVDVDVIDNLAKELIDQR